MRFGLSFLPDVSPAEKSSQDYFAEAFALCDIAEQGELDYVKMTEHYLHPYGGYCPSPLAFLSAVAARTKNIRLMTGCILPVFHHPIQIAAETAMLDAISHGRLDVGFARAYLPYEFQAFEIDMDESRERYIETIQAVKKLWTQQNVSVNTKFFSFEHANSLPRPVQNPHPPIWSAAVNSRQSFSWIGEQGFGLLMTPPPGPIAAIGEKIALYRETFLENHGNTDYKPCVALSLPICIDESADKAIRLSDLYLQRYLDVWASAADAWDTKHSTDYPGYTGLSQVLRANSPEKMRNNLQALVGNPAKIIADIQTISSFINIDILLLQIDYGGQPFDVARNTLNLFIEEVK